MQSWTYPARIERHDTDTGAPTWIVTFADLPECITEGASAEDAAHQAVDALATAVAFYLEHGKPVPPPRAAGKGEVSVTLEPALAARAALASIMADQGMTKVALAAKLGKDEKTVRQLLQPRGASMDAVLRALQAVGARPVLSV